MEFDELTRVKGTQEPGIFLRTLVVRKDKKEHVVFSPHISQKTISPKKKDPNHGYCFLLLLSALAGLLFFWDGNRTTISQLFCISLEFLETLAIGLRIGTNTTHTTLRLEQRWGSCGGNTVKKKGTRLAGIDERCHYWPTPSLSLLNCPYRHCVERAKHYSFLLSNPNICKSIRMIMVGEGTQTTNLCNHLQERACMVAGNFYFLSNGIRAGEEL